MSNIYSKLALIQMSLKVPKNLHNSFGNYNYRSCEAILEELKPLLSNEGTVLTISDEIVNIGDRFYVKATATLWDAETSESISNTAYAREELSKKGMDGSQITGAASSYARKYCLAGMFALDDTKDADTDTWVTTTNQEAEQIPQMKAEPSKAVTNKNQGLDLANMCAECGATIKSFKIIDYSLKRYGKPLCYTCQQRQAA